MSHATERRTDVITSADHAALRAELFSQANDEIFSDAFRASCWGAIAAIDQVRAEDEATHAQLEAGLNALVAVGAGEMQRCQQLRRMLDRLAETNTPKSMRAILGDLLPLLSGSNLADVAATVSTIFTGIRPAWYPSTPGGSFHRAAPRTPPC